MTLRRAIKKEIARSIGRMHLVLDFQAEVEANWRSFIRKNIIQEKQILNKWKKYSFQLYESGFFSARCIFSRKEYFVKVNIFLLYARVFWWFAFSKVYAVCKVAAVVFGGVNKMAIKEFIFKFIMIVKRLALWTLVGEDWSNLGDFSRDVCV